MQAKHNTPLLITDGSAAELESSSPDSSDLRPVPVVYTNDIEGISVEMMNFGLEPDTHATTLGHDVQAVRHQSCSSRWTSSDQAIQDSTTISPTLSEFQNSQLSKRLCSENELDQLCFDGDSVEGHDSEQDREEIGLENAQSATIGTGMDGSIRVPRMIDSEDGGRRPAWSDLESEYANFNDPIYKPLNENTQSIRLLSFQAPNGIVSAKLEQFDDVKTCPPFIALSYTWGNAWPLQEIELNGSPFEVWPNLYEFMESARFARSEWAQKVYGEDAAAAVTENSFLENPILWDYWWIDAICIDQNSIREKNHQVGIMGDIYSQAAFVFVWLGNEMSSSRTIRALPVNKNHDHDIQKLQPASRHADRDVLETVSEPSCTVEVATALLENPYWTRLWIVQEFVLAKDLLLCAGSLVLKWKELRDMIIDLGTRYKLQNHHLNSLMNQRYHKEQGERQEGLSALVDKFYEHQCADPRDRVFGLLGLSNTQLKADYALKAEEIFIGVMDAEMETIFDAAAFEAFWSSSRTLSDALDMSVSDGARLRERFYKNKVPNNFTFDGSRFSGYLWPV